MIAREHLWVATLLLAFAHAVPPGAPGADGTTIRGLADDGASGLVVVSMGRGNLSAEQEKATVALSRTRSPS